MASDTKTAIVPPKRANTDYPVCTTFCRARMLLANLSQSSLSTPTRMNCLTPKNPMFDRRLTISSRHLRRVFGYARPSDYAMAGGMATVSPIAFWVMERVSPSHVGRGGFAPVMRLATAVGLIGGLHVLYQRSCRM